MQDSNWDLLELLLIKVTLTKVRLIKGSHLSKIYVSDSYDKKEHSTLQSTAYILIKFTVFI